MQQSNKTFGSQHLLPRLPVPALDETCDRYIRWLAPLLTEAEWRRTRTIVDEFRKKGGVGESLQAKLVEWSENPGLANWLEPFWDDKYLASRLPLPVNVNFATVCDENPRAADLSQIKRSALITALALRFKHLIDTGALEVDRHMDGPLCMMQFKKLFATTRIPKRDKDSLRSSCTENDTASPAGSHILVLNKGRLFTLKSHTDSGSRKSIGEIERDLETILSMGNEPALEGSALGILTAMDRNGWADAREMLYRSHPQNIASLNAIETGLFALCLDDSHPISLEERFRDILHGDGKNRWFDKSFQFIVAKNGEFGVNGEHSGLDGYPVHRLIKFIYDESGHSTLMGTDNGKRSASRPERLEFYLNDSLKEIIAHAETRFDALKNDTLSRVFEYTAFGKGLIKSFKVSPDAFIQLALQLAQYQLFGKCKSTYESASTRQFLHGRTETLRPVSSESLQFIQNMLSTTCDHSTRKMSLTMAAQKHVARMKGCMAGKGVERHLFGLLSIYERFGKDLGILSEPEIFKDSGWHTLRHDTFSTTSNPDPHGVVLSGFGPAVDDGFGICYTIIEDRITFTITGRSGMRKELEQFIVNLTQAFSEMSRVMQAS